MKGKNMIEDEQSTLCHAFALSLACALIESARNDTDPHSALGNRLARASETTERAISYFPRVRDNFDAMFLANDFLPLLEQRINSVILHGGWRRGEVACDRFMQNMLARLNDPKNVAKGDYLAMTWPEVRDKVREEQKEVEAEMWALATGSGNPAAAIREFADLAVCAMIGAEKVEVVSGIHG